MSRERGDGGTMLVELLVGMILMSIVGMLVLDGVIGAVKGQRHLQFQSAALEDVRRNDQRITREVREADPVLRATSTTLDVRHDTDTGTVRKQWWTTTSGGVTSLVQRTTVTVSGVAQAPVERTVISDLNPATSPFSYAPVPGWTAPAGVAVDATTCALTGTSPVEYLPECVGSVTLHLERNVTGHTSVTVHSTVDVRNRS